MKIISVIENKARTNLYAEHGLCIYIMYHNKHFLLDSGSTALFASNAQRLGIELKEIDAAVLSHGHYDHAGGYQEFFHKNQKAKVFLRKEAADQHYKIVGPLKKYIGIPENLIREYKERFIFVEGKYQIEEGIWLIPHATESLENKGELSHLYRNTEEGIKPDNFKHEQSLVFENNDKLVVFTSCSHGGIENIIREILEVFEGKKIQAVIGGFHLMGTEGPETLNMEPSKVEELGNFLLNQGIKEIYTGHCTGNPGFSILKNIMGDKVHYFAAGESVVL